MSLETRIYFNYKILKRRHWDIDSENEYSGRKDTVGTLIWLPLAEKFKMPIQEIKRIVREQREIARKAEHEKQDAKSDERKAKQKRQARDTRLVKN